MRTRGSRITKNDAEGGRLGRDSQQGGNSRHAGQEWPAGRAALHAADAQLLRQALQGIQAGAQDLRHGQLDRRPPPRECRAPRAALRWRGPRRLPGGLPPLLERGLAQGARRRVAACGSGAGKRIDGGGRMGRDARAQPTAGRGAALRLPGNPAAGFHDAAAVVGRPPIRGGLHVRQPVAAPALQRFHLPCLLSWRPNLEKQAGSPVAMAL